MTVSQNIENGLKSTFFSGNSVKGETTTDKILGDTGSILNDISMLTSFIPYGTVLSAGLQTVGSGLLSAQTALEYNQGLISKKQELTDYAMYGSSMALSLLGGASVFKFQRNIANELNDFSGKSMSEYKKITEILRDKYAKETSDLRDVRQVSNAFDTISESKTYLESRVELNKEWDTAYDKYEKAQIDLLNEIKRYKLKPPDYEPTRNVGKKRYSINRRANEIWNEWTTRVPKSETTKKIKIQTYATDMEDTIYENIRKLGEVDRKIREDRYNEYLIEATPSIHDETTLRRLNYRQNVKIILQIQSKVDIDFIDTNFEYMSKVERVFNILNKSLLPSSLLSYSLFND
jgi:hypothetical protein